MKKSLNKPNADLDWVALVALCLGLLVLALSMGCAHHERKSVVAPEYAAVNRKVEDITKTISLVQSDNKEVKRIQVESLSLLDRLDYKTTILLK